MRSFKKLLLKIPEYYQELSNAYASKTPPADINQDSCEDLILANFLSKLKQQPSKIGKNNYLEDIYDLRNDDSKISDKVPQGIPDDFPNTALFSNGENYKKCKEENEKLIQGIKSIKENEMRNESQDDSFIQLTLDTIDEFGSNPYKDGTIAAQSMDFVKADVTLFWSVCGEGMFGRDNDVNYADLISNAIDAESMKQVREDLGVNRIAAASATQDEFNAVSAFMALNAKRTVYIAAGSQYPLGQYLTEVELPILLRNPNVTSIELIDTSTSGFLERLKGIAERCNSDAGFNLQGFQDEAKKLINDTGAKREIFNRTGKNITKGNVEEVKQGVINMINSDQQSVEELRKREKDLDKESMFDRQYGLLKSDMDKLERQIKNLDSDLKNLDSKLKGLNLEKGKLIQIQNKNKNDFFVDTRNNGWNPKYDVKKASGQLEKVNKRLDEISSEIEKKETEIKNKENERGTLKKDLDKRNLEMQKHQDMRKPLSYLKAFKEQRRKEKTLAEEKSGPLITLNNTIKKARKQRNQQKQPLTK